MRPLTGEPVIVDFGRQCRGLFPHQELIDSLRRAFKHEKADYIVLDSYRSGQHFLAAAVALGIDNGWLYTATHEDHGQDGDIATFRLAPKGREYFGLPSPEPEPLLEVTLLNATTKTSPYKEKLFE